MYVLLQAVIERYLNILFGIVVTTYEDKTCKHTTVT